jgi:hypothetical protein
LNVSRRVLQFIVLGAAWLICAQSAQSQGTIQYVQPATPIALFTRDFPEYYSLDLDGDAVADMTFTYSFQFLGVQPAGANRILTLLSPPPNVGGSVAPLPSGFAIGPDSEAGSLGWYGQALDYNTLAVCFDVGCAGAFLGQHAYMGVEFQRAGAAHYGWVLLNVASDYPAGSIEAWAWDTRSGTPILAGAVPEPSCISLCVLGILLIFTRRSQSRVRL